MASNLITNYNGPQVAITAIGAGSLLNAITLFPGSARVIATVHSPYSVEAVRSFIQDATCNGIDDLEYPEASAVSLEMLKALNEASNYRYSNLAHVVVTGAVCSLRYRRGNDHAYVSINNEAFHLKLLKLTPEEHATPGDIISRWRYKQDEQVSIFCIEKLLGLDQGLYSVIEEVEALGPI